MPIFSIGINIHQYRHTRFNKIKMVDIVFPNVFGTISYFFFFFIFVYIYKHISICKHAYIHQCVHHFNLYVYWLCLNKNPTEIIYRVLHSNIYFMMINYSTLLHPQFLILRLFYAIHPLFRLILYLLLENQWLNLNHVSVIISRT